MKSYFSVLWEEISHIIFTASYDTLILFFFGILQSLDSFTVLRKRVSPCIYSQVSVSHVRVSLEGFVHHKYYFNLLLRFFGEKAVLISDLLLSYRCFQFQAQPRRVSLKQMCNLISLCSFLHSGKNLPT